MAYTNRYANFETNSYRKVSYGINKGILIFMVDTTLLRNGKGPSILTNLFQNISK